ncbi:glutamate-5-semialdehyde dehydrogenase [Thecaphora frezii]
MSIGAEHIAKRAKLAFDEAQHRLTQGAAADQVRCAALHQIRNYLEAAKPHIQAANHTDVQLANQQVAAGKLSASLASRLDLFSKPGKWESMLQGITDVASLPSPLDQCTYAKRLAEPTPTSGALDLYRLTCPIGVLLCIFEARPEVIINIASLAIKSGNAAILKGGKESKHTAAVMAKVVAEALASTPLPSDLVQTVETRSDVAALLHQDRYIDLVIPRGSNELVRSIQREARMPVMGHADGLCAGYIHEDAEVEMTVATIIDAKTDYPAACNALETLLLHRSHLSTGLWSTLSAALLSVGVTLHCDEATLGIASDALSRLPSTSTPSLGKVVAAVASDFDTEFLDLDLAVKVVDDVDEAIRHINTHGSHHTDIILCRPLGPSSSSSTTYDPAQPATEHAAAKKFTQGLCSANVFVNASSRFADGFRYGFGTEVGISTGKTHARGPVGLEGLVIYKYVIKASGRGAQAAAEFSRQDEEKREWAHKELEKRYPTF